MKRLLIFFAAIPLILGSCNPFDYHPYDGKITGETDINNKNKALIESKLEGKKSFKFAMFSDTQRSYNDTEDVVKHINKNKEIEFAIHCGDVADFGLTREYEWQRDILKKLNIPYVAIIGNHDFLANGADIFTKIFGEPNFSFIAGNVKFVCINTNALELDYSTPSPDFHFIRDERTKDSARYEKTIFAMHARPFSDQFDNNVAEIFQDEIKKYPNLLFCMNGHDHRLAIDDLFEDGLIYYGISNIHKRQYFIFTINEDDYKYEVVDF